MDNSSEHLWKCMSGSTRNVADNTSWSAIIFHEWILGRGTVSERGGEAVPKRNAQRTRICAMQLCLVALGNATKVVYVCGCFSRSERTLLLRRKLLSYFAGSRMQGSPNLFERNSTGLITKQSFHMHCRPWSLVQVVFFLKKCDIGKGSVEIIHYFQM